MSRRFVLSVAVSSLAIASVAAAEETRHAEAHVHGAGALNIAMEGEELAIQLVAPSHDLLGFEYAPETDGEKDALEAMEALLSDPAALFGLPEGADCHTESAEIHHFGKTHALEIDDHGPEHDKDDDDHADHDDHTDHGHDDHADHESHDHDHDHETHSDIEASWSLHCENPGALTGLDLAYFDAFPRAEKLDIVILTADNQMAVTATPENTGVDF